MDVVTGWRDLPAQAKGAVLAIGHFDGVHRGHQAVLGRARELALAAGKRSGAVVFEPHPREFFAPDQSFFRLTPLSVKLELLAALGLDETFVIDFGPELSSLSAEAFGTEVVAKGLGASRVVVGYDFTYGRGRTGTPAELKALGARLDFGVEIIEPVANNGAVFSSSKIRVHLRNGEIQKAAEQLGYWWRVRGKVERGAGRGKGLGFPTVNLLLEPGQGIAHGIYAVRVEHKVRRYHGAGYIGPRPTFGGGRPLLEAYLFDFAGDLYGEEIEVELIEKLRGDATFANSEELAAQMQRDCARIRALLTVLEVADPMARFPLGHALGHGTGL
jgi:riboflavin kinase / FMN adenylyltransferase